MYLSAFMDLIVSELETNLSLLYNINIGKLSKVGGLSIELVPSPPTTTFLNKSIEDEKLILFLCKDKNQLNCLNELDKIRDYLIKKKKYPSSMEFEWVNSYVSTDIEYVDNTEDGNYIYSMIIGNKIIH